MKSFGNKNRQLILLKRRVALPVLFPNEVMSMALIWPLLRFNVIYSGLFRTCCTISPFLTGAISFHFSTAILI